MLEVCDSERPPTDDGGLQPLLKQSLLDLRCHVAARPAEEDHPPDERLRRGGVGGGGVDRLCGGGDGGATQAEKRC